MERYQVEIHEDGRVMTTANLTRAQAERLVAVVQDQALRQGRRIQTRLQPDIPAGAGA